MPGIEIKGRSKRANYRHGGRTGYAAGTIVKGGIKAGKRFLDFIKSGKLVDKKGVKVNVPKAAERLTGKPHVDRIKKAGGGSPHSTDEGKHASLKRSFNRIRKFGVQKGLKELMGDKKKGRRPLNKS